ncbi:hypothetical protein G9A89_005123 [Geosiphon pyriformis]|nr:hypothetical protein G9A89_005123 [Geosiphon pyriformis]
MSNQRTKTLDQEFYQLWRTICTKQSWKVLSKWMRNNGKLFKISKGNSDAQSKLGRWCQHQNGVRTWKEQFKSSRGGKLKYAKQSWRVLRRWMGGRKDGKTWKKHLNSIQKQHRWEIQMHNIALEGVIKMEKE